MNSRYSITEVEQKISHFRRLLNLLLQDLSKYFSKSICSRYSVTIPPGRHFSYILQRQPRKVIDKLNYTFEKNKAEIFEDWETRKFKKVINIDYLDIAALCDILTSLPVFPTCQKCYIPTGHTYVIEHINAQCLNVSVCCGMCYRCARCSPRCVCSTWNLKQVKKVRNETAHMCPITADAIEKEFTMKPYSEIAQRWEDVAIEMCHLLMGINRYLHTNKYYRREDYDRFKGTLKTLYSHYGDQVSPAVQPKQDIKHKARGNNMRTPAVQPKQGNEQNVMPNNRSSPVVQPKQGNEKNVMSNNSRMKPGDTTICYQELNKHMRKNNCDKIENMLKHNPRLLRCVFENDQMTLLMRATQWKRRKLIKILLSSGDDAHAVDEHGDNVLHYCVEHNNITAAEIILSRYPQLVSKVNKIGETAFTLAFKRGYKSMERCILTYVDHSRLHERDRRTIRMNHSFSNMRDGWKFKIDKILKNGFLSLHAFASF